MQSDNLQPIDPNRLSHELIAVLTNNARIIELERQCADLNKRVDHLESMAGLGRVK